MRCSYEYISIDCGVWGRNTIHVFPTHSISSAFVQNGYSNFYTHKIQNFYRSVLAIGSQFGEVNTTCLMSNKLVEDNKIVE